MEGTKKSLYLFEVELDEDELQALIQLDPELLKKLLFRCSRIFQKQLNNRAAVAIFLNNYRMVMELHSAMVGNSFSVNLCLHFALLYCQFLLLEGRQNEAKGILKQTENYIDIEGIDDMLVSLCLNNLVYLYSKQGKYYKSLAVALKAIGILQEHLECLSLQKKRGQLIEDVIVFVNVLIVTQRILTNILTTNSKTFFKTLFKIVNRLGYSFSQKYLGTDSIFTKKFYLPEDSVLLPVYQAEEEQVQQQEEHFQEFQARIAQELQHIYSCLKQLNLEPEIYYIKEHSIKSKTQEKMSSIHIETIPPEQEEFSVSFTESFMISDWQAEVSIFREASDLLVASPTYQFLGHVQFKFQKNRKVFFQKIPEQKLIKILNCLNIYDVLPFEYELKSMTASDFFRRILIHFISCSTEGSLIIYPRAIPVIEPFQMRFCSQNTVILVNHISFKRFRVAICPKDSSETIYLQVEFKCKEIYHLYKLTQLLIPGISQLHKDYYSSEQLQDQNIKFHRVKQVQAIKTEAFKSIILEILKEFEVFITEDDEDIFNELLTSSMAADDNYKYYHFVMNTKGKGQFYQFRYRSNANHIEIYTKNNFDTYTPQGLQKVKGNIVVSPQQFFKQFGISMKVARKWLQSFYGLMVQKFTLKVFENPIQEMEEDRFEQNAILELPFICKFFKRKFVFFEDYMLPLTIQLISVNTEKPIGIKVSVYEPIKGINSGLFIYVNADYWEKPAEKPIKEQKSFAEQYLEKEQRCHNFKKGYFLTRWLTEQGFEKIASKITISNRSLQIRGHSGKFIKLQQLL